MPRTKSTRKSKTANDSVENVNLKLRTFDRQVENCIWKLQQDGQAEVRSFENLVDMMVSRLPAEIRQMTLAEILALESNDLKENCEVSSSGIASMRPPATVSQATRSANKTGVRHARATRNTNKTGVRCARATSDDGYATEGGTSSVASTSQTTRALRRMRNSIRESKAEFSEITQKTVKKHSNVPTLNFKTPALPKSNANMYDVVIPKIKPNTPLNVLRRPRKGEMVLSMQGSPLLVSAIVEEKTANVNVPLSDGNMMSLLPQEGLRISHVPPLDAETMHQLKTLKKHIETVIRLK